MSWWGKAFGGTMGFILGGPIGALIGVALGHGLDRKTAEYTLYVAHDSDAHGGDAADRQRVQTVFFTTLFSVMGHVAKVDGRVCKDEIEIAQRIMARLNLDATLRAAAIRLFNEGKRTEFPLGEVLAQFKREAHHRRNLLRMFLELLIQAAYADGVMHAAERRLLLRVAAELGFSAAEFDRLEAMIRAVHDGGARRAATGRAASSLADAYAVLNLDAGASDDEVKKSYRRLLSQHHPDKLVAKGLPEEMMKLAAERTHQIRAAYERIREARGF